MNTAETLIDLATQLDAMAAEEKAKHANASEKVRTFAEGQAFGLKVAAAMLRKLVKEQTEEPAPIVSHAMRQMARLYDLSDPVGFGRAVNMCKRVDGYSLNQAAKVVKYLQMEQQAALPTP